MGWERLLLSKQPVSFSVFIMLSSMEAKERIMGEGKTGRKKGKE